ncbi:hypothetical protein GGTG_09814 [Gaeumannomyces tritici R3-111a-1]|uniref:Uncharacterized protein n=1 Tax=Gaeumannomyces tritici (strain R3-111a-1) TaxID=644352 RepID=J3P8I0_GAET3|nr:hypothetical protein GGTG_09814 [Gaeumannomyces tritici R3-111a-1]EJT72963.1 hypothetical protein GGTG_09814 [Gaeumannomyces tritici R3-111a-1]
MPLLAVVQENQKKEEQKKDLVRGRFGLQKRRKACPAPLAPHCVQQLSRNKDFLALYHWFEIIYYFKFLLLLKEAKYCGVFKMVAQLRKFALKNPNHAACYKRNF